MMAAVVRLVEMARSKLSEAAAALGRKGGAVRSEAKTAAVRANGKLGGRPVKLHEVGGETVHADVDAAGKVGSLQAFRARTPAAARWLARHGFERVDLGKRPVLWIKR